MFHVSVFADEIASDLREQIRTLREEGIRRLDLRSAWNRGILSWEREEIDRARRILREEGVSVSAIGSPIGKTRINEDEEAFRASFRRCLEIASALEAPAVRVFSFYRPEGESSWDPWRAKVVERCGWMSEEAARAGIVLHHENERGIFGETPENCALLHREIDRDSFRCVFDFANFVQAGIPSVREAYETLESRVVAFHLKDARRGDGVVMPAGEGDGDVAAVLARAAATGRDYPLTIEPHLSGNPDLARRDAVERFRIAAAAMRKVLEGIGSTWD